MCSMTVIVFIVVNSSVVIVSEISPADNSVSQVGMFGITAGIENGDGHTAAIATIFPKLRGLDHLNTFGDFLDRPAPLPLGTVAV